MEDNRRHARVPLHTSIEYRPDGAAGDFLLQSSRNVSEGGLFIETRSPEPIGTRLDVVFALPSDERVVARGVVAWVNPWRDDGPNPNPGMGIRFEGLPMEHREAIARLVRRILIVPEVPAA